MQGGKVFVAVGPIKDHATSIKHNSMEDYWQVRLFALQGITCEDSIANLNT